MTREEAIHRLAFMQQYYTWRDEEFEAFEMAIKALQTDIVWCKDCKYKGKVGDLIVCRIHEISTRTDDYCSRGERNEE